jgi:hypothetical protein
VNSLDEVYEQMRLFQQTLTEFNAEMRASAAELSKAHDQVCGIWQDEAAQGYRSAYEPLANSLDLYLRANAPRFEKFIESKAGQLQRYLNE